MALNLLDCRICGSDELQEIPEFTSLPRVTGDCKPFASGGRLEVCLVCGAVQKPMDAQWQQEVDAIFANYQPYFQSGGVEQAIFDAGVGRVRSDVLIERLDTVHTLKKFGTALDVGCGTGVFLKALSRASPQWQLFGYDINDRHVSDLQGISGFGGLYTGALGDIPKTFDLISFSHSLQDLPEPVRDIQALLPKLKPEGCLFIQVPDREATPFDLVIAEQILHFSRQDLAYLLDRAGFAPLVLANDWATKEISVVAVSKRAQPAMPLPPSDPSLVVSQMRGHIAWLQQMMTEARKAADEAAPFGIFGSSVAAAWLFGELGEQTAFFVDEDIGRRGKMMFGRPVILPADIPAGACVYLPLIPKVARAVAARLARAGIQFREPPRLGD